MALERCSPCSFVGSLACLVQADSGNGGKWLVAKPYKPDRGQMHYRAGLNMIPLIEWSVIGNAQSHGPCARRVAGCRPRPVQLRTHQRMSPQASMRARR